MAEEEIIAVFKADIEQFKAQMSTLTTKLDQVEKKTDAAGATTEKFSGHTKSASTSIKSLSQGLGGISGLLSITGKLFGVNADQLQELVFASREFIKVGREIAHTQHLGAVATAEATAAEKAFNLVKSASLGIWSLIATAIGVVSVAVFKYISASKESERAIVSQIEFNNLLIANNKIIATQLTELAKLKEDNALQEKINLGTASDADKKRLDILRETIKDESAIRLSALTDIREINKEEDQRLLNTQRTVVRESGDILITIQENIEHNARVNQERSNRIAKRTQQQDQEIANNRKIQLEKNKTVEVTANKELSDEQKKALDEKKKQIIKNNDEIFQLALKQIEALKKLGQIVESPIEKINREHEERLKSAGLFGRDELSLTEFEHAQLIAEERDYQAQIQEIVDKSEQEQQKLRDAAFKLDEQTQKEEDDAFLKNKKQAQDKILELAKKGNKDALEILSLTQADEFAKIEEDNRQKRIDLEQKALDTIFKAQQDAFDRRKELGDKEITLQEKHIATQRRLAENGLTNTLAFEEKRAAELQRQQQLDAQKQKRVKLLETFLNALAEYSKTDPKSAIPKALLQVALAQAASAVFAEEGGVIGEIGARSNRKHRGGGDILVHAQTGEGILPRDAMSAIGRRNFELLKNAGRHPIRDDVFAMPKLAYGGSSVIDNRELLKEVQGLRKDIRNQPRETWQVDKFGDYIKTQIEQGVTIVTKGKLPKPRFK